MSSDIIKSGVIAVAIIVMNFLLRDAFIQSEFDRLQRPHHEVEKGTEVAPQVEPMSPGQFSREVTQVAKPAPKATPQAQ